MRNSRLPLMLALAVPTLVSAQAIPGADPVGLRGDASGSWYNPAQPGHGLMVELRDRNEASLAWYTFDAAGAPMWLVGTAKAERNVLRGPVFRVAGGAFPPAFDPARTTTAPWGELVVTLDGCNSGTVAWTPTAPGFAAGSMPLSRLTSIHGARCNTAEEFEETRSWSFERGKQGFDAVFADRPPNEDAFYELEFAYEALPAPLDGFRGLRLSGNNHSDDLAMLVKRKVEGFAPNTTYRVELEADIASNVPAGCAGVGGSPGEGVYLKLGVSQQEPLTSLVGEFLRLNIDYGQQSQSGENVKVVGTLANSYSCDVSTEAPWESETITTRGQQVRVTTDADGAFWIIAGSDSAFEGRTDFYFTSVTLRVAKAP